jgi:osmotically-inducible protein OsmY
MRAPHPTPCSTVCGDRMIAAEWCPPGIPDANSPGMEDLDTAIKREVQALLCSHHGIHATELQVHVDAGVVDLTGTVRCLAESVAAEKAAYGVRGVIEVLNALSVGKPGGVGQSDLDLARAVRQALVWNTLVPDEAISTSVTDGAVRLHGTVDDPTEREEAERSVSHLAGVRQVHNLLEVRPRERLVDSVLRAVEAAIELPANANAGCIRVDAYEGRVTLSGVVESAANRCAALQAAERAPGVRSVEDHLRIDGA